MLWGDERAVPVAAWRCLRDCHWLREVWPPEVLPREDVGTVTAQEIIDTLSRLSDKSLPVTIDGCDCSETASAIYFDGETVIIARPDTERLYDEGDRL